MGMNNTLNLVRGYPGQGKTTFANRFFANIPKFENDMYFYRNGVYCYDASKMRNAIEWCLRNAERCLKEGMDVCVSNTFTKISFVNSYRNLAEKYGADFRIYRMMGEFGNIHNVPPDVFKNMKSNFEAYDGEILVYPDENANQGYDFR